MKNKILWCTACKNFTMKATCAVCKQACINPLPAKFSLTDHYSSYRLKARGVLL